MSQNREDEQLENILRDLQPGSELQIGQYTYKKLDRSKKNDTGTCKHQWEKDSPNHWVCRKCGFGTSRAELVFTTST